jgi:hypothetical protein
MDKKMINKEEIIDEYVTGNISYRALGKKHETPIEPTAPPVKTDGENLSHLPAVMQCRHGHRAYASYAPTFRSKYSPDISHSGAYTAVL